MSRFLSAALYPFIVCGLSEKRERKGEECGEGRGGVLASGEVFWQGRPNRTGTLSDW